MDGGQRTFVGRIGVAVLLILSVLGVATVLAQPPVSAPAEQRDMRLVGHDDLSFYVPATTARTDKRCVTVGGATRCRIAIQTNNVEVDDRGFIYLVVRADTGLDIVELTDAARAIANLP